MIQSFHNNMMMNLKGTVQFDSNLSEPFNIRSGVKQGYVLAPTLFGIFFAMLLKHAFGTSSERVYLLTRSDGKLFNLADSAQTKVRRVVIRDMLFADDAAVVSHTHKNCRRSLPHFPRFAKTLG